jgi:hypothetical protein
VKTKLKLISAVSVCLGLGVTIVSMPSCTPSQFTSDTGGPPAKKPITTGDQSPPENGNNPPGFAKEGKSLDLYVIMDKSGSLYVDPVTQQMNSGSDVQCKRFDALLTMVDSLRGKLNSNEEVRLTVVTFSKNAAQLGTMDQLLNQPRQLIKDTFRPGVCDNPDYETTNYERGISATLNAYENNRSKKKLDLDSVVFFSDGAARDKDTGILEESIRRLNSTFPSRVYGVLLGSTRDQCVLRDTAGRFLQTNECVLKVVGNSPARLLSVEDAAGLSAAWAELVNR